MTGGALYEYRCMDSNVIAEKRQTAAATTERQGGRPRSSVASSCSTNPGAGEIRALGDRSGKYANTWSVLPDDFAEARRTSPRLDANRKPKGIYTTLNPVLTRALGTCR